MLAPLIRVNNCMPLHLDFTKVPTLDKGHFFMRIERDVALEIGHFRRLMARANNAVRFISWSEGDSTLLHCNESEVQQLREGCFRAALTEFASMEDVQRLDYEEHGVVRAQIKLNDTANPLLHIFRELRNLEIHLRHSKLRSFPKDVLWGKKEVPLTIDIWVVEGVTPESFALLRNAKNYSSQQIEQMVNWFNAAQAEWGVQELFLLAVEEYCRELMDR